MEKHAYLLMVHNNYFNLEILLKMLDDERNDIYINVDRKVRNFPDAFFINVVHKSKLFLYHEVSVNWGGFSQVQCEMFLMKQAASGLYKYYHLLSGADLPIKTQDDIWSFFEKNEGFEFVQFDDGRLNQFRKEFTRRVDKYHFIQEYRKCSNKRIIKGALTWLAKGLLGLQVLLRIDRWSRQKLILKYGSQWFSITHDFVTFLLENEDRIRDLFTLTQCPDESFVQIMLFNSTFRERCYQFAGNHRQSGNLREINWEKSSDPAHPYVWKREDLEYLFSSPNLFARKFDENLDREIMIRLYEEVMGRRVE